MYCSNYNSFRTTAATSIVLFVTFIESMDAEEEIDFIVDTFQKLQVTNQQILEQQGNLLLRLQNLRQQRKSQCPNYQNGSAQLGPEFMERLNIERNKQFVEFRRQFPIGTAVIILNPNKDEKKI